MCFVVALFQVNPEYPLVVAANRDESRVRPSRPPFSWPGNPPLWAGRDEVSGGTWLGVNAAGVLAAITNRRDGPVEPNLPSRGILCLDVLRQASPAGARRSFEEALASQRFNPFNLLCASTTEGWVANGRGTPRPLSPGPHMLTNLGDLDDDNLPMVRHAWELLDRIDLRTPSLENLFSALGRLCADTVGSQPICRVGGDRGTVSSSLIALRQDGGVAAYWHANGPPTDHPYVSVNLEGIILTRRPARDSDIDFARLVHHQAYHDVVERQFGHWIDEDQDRFFTGDWNGAAFEIILCNDVPCGYVCIEDQSDCVHVREIVLSPTFQSRGIGSAILRDAIDQARRRRVPVRLGALHQNQALNLYHRLGFRETGRTGTHVLMEWHDEG